MTLHEAIVTILQKRGKPMLTSEIADELNRLSLYRKKDGSKITAFQVHGRTRNYPSLFDRDGSSVALKGSRFSGASRTKVGQLSPTKVVKQSNSDESYVIDLCDGALGLKASRQHRFDFLLGDPSPNGKSVKLPVDAYYESVSLVVEYRELQHSESVSFFDKADKVTVSGVHRGEQRRIYDERRRAVLPQNGISLVEISYSDFQFDSKKRIIRDREKDLIVIKRKLDTFL
jgi:hypothetical protein